VSKVAKKVPHLTIKGGRFYFRMRVPLPLVPFLGAEVGQALGDVTKAQAEVMVRELAAENAALFLREKHRRGFADNPPAPAPSSARRAATADDVDTIARSAARELLARDQGIRINGMRSELGDWWRSSLADLDRALVVALSDGDMRGLWHDFIRDLKAHGVALPEDTGERRTLVHRWAMEQAKAVQGIKQREDGVPVETPAPVAPPAARGKEPRLRDAFDAWRTSARRPEKTVKAFERHLEVFEKTAGNPPLSSIRRADAVRFRDALQQWAVDKRKTAATADNTLTSIKALANIARDREWIEGNPFERLAVTKGGRDSEGREPWTAEEMAVLFDAPLFKEYALPEGDSIATKGGAGAAYWVPLIAAYTGARPGEICQLWTDDLSEGEGGLVIEFRENAARGQKLKGGKVSWRAVPVHSELIRLGLREYWQSVKASGPGALFPLLPKDGENGAAGQFGQWFSAFKTGQGFDTSTKTLHSFRHTVETELGFAGVTDTLVDAITGHAGRGIGRKVYAATIRRESERLRDTIQLLNYPGINLPRVYR
jgi:integrase